MKEKITTKTKKELESSKKLAEFLDKTQLHKRDFAQMIGVTLSYVYNLIDNTIPFSDEANSGWKSKNHYFYEIINNRGSEFYMQFVLNGENLTDEQKNIAEEINKISPSKQQKIVWQWRTHFSTKRIKTDDELDEQKIISQLEKLLQEIKAFEASLLDKLKKC